MILSWFKRKAAAMVPPPLKPMEIVPGAEYIMQVGNPFQPDPTVRVLEVREDWVQYVFKDAPSTRQHTKVGYFRHCYKPLCSGDEESK